MSLSRIRGLIVEQEMPDHRRQRGLHLVLLVVGAVTFHVSDAAVIYDRMKKGITIATGLARMVRVTLL